MEKKKIEEIDALLQRLLDRELGESEKQPPPKRTRGGKGNVIRRRKGQPDKRIALPNCP
ncbi:MAG: hypothetical protein GY697_21120 [Desulfobacterales bacterium]|nr:hypothetical protein [Desulfobacterales bacterium]